jgi:hypothetical protein
MTNEITPVPAPVKKAALKKTPPITKTRKPRTIDPAVEAIRAEARDKIKSLAGSRASNRILQTIVSKRLAQLTPEHKQALYDELAKTCTQKLIT